MVVLSDDNLNLARSAYDGICPSTFWGVRNLIPRTDSHSEKPARGTLFSAMQRQMGQDTILVVDSLNYIKGFRYQMYCAAREMKIRVCTVSASFRRFPFFNSAQ